MENAFRLEEVAERIALLTFDQPGSKVNVLSGSAFEQLANLLGEIQKRRDFRGLLLKSGKPGQFIAGADLNELASLTYVPKEKLPVFVARGHEVFDQVAQLPWPTVALIDGPCLGGGAECALATDYRIASDNPKTRIGLPEVTLGIIPSWGGTQRLPRLIGVSEAIDMICSGEPISAGKAAALGLVSQVVPADRLVDEGCRLIQRVQESGKWERERHRQRQPVGLNSDQLREIFAGAESDLKRKTKGHYPAPLVALRTIREGCVLPLDEGLKRERSAAPELMGTTISANLIAVFSMKQRLARDRGVADPNVPARSVQRVGVLGAGLMGSGIAVAHARCAISTAMVDVDEGRVADGLAKAQKVVASRIESGRAGPDEMDHMLAHLSTSTAHQVFADCDLVVEAITEDEAAKTDMYRSLAGVLGGNAILASNTSTISITRLAESAPSADQFIGIHFFNPVDRMPLVEVVRGERTSEETVATAVALAKRVGKTPIVVRDGPGFLVNRVLFPYLNEAVLLLLEGASMDAIDSAATRFGMPMGPLLLHDVIGLDTVCCANSVLREALGDRVASLPIRAELVQAGRLGQKSGAGFRKYEAAQPKGTADPAFQPVLERHQTEVREISDDELADRLFLPMLLEATRVLEESLVREPAHLDLGLVLGLGFPTFRGGILRWCDTEGAEQILRRVEKYATLGDRFQPTETLQRLARSAAPFYPRPA
jgi:3-hydroxyacyl-CoA dehydrogenase/enoyl-CoA hydratase/3-hydroxybutyryl-CoA epimerase/3-hydroxyacyl-CoA dehydrogenase/enoyl-CoA hydratase/3-hydroxybutyryl-CoA epimerase/enoyl-CoA isomerase